MLNKTIRACALLAAALATTSVPGLAPAQDSSDVVNIYSARQEALIQPLLEIFQERTGIAYNLLSGNADELLRRLELEGDATPADVFITVDAGRLYRAKQAGVLQPIDDEAVTSAVPGHLQDEDGLWVGLSKRARVIVYSADRVSGGELSTYEALADGGWANRICIRSSSNIYNQSLVASMIEAAGTEATESWARGIVANMARHPAGGDTDQIKAAAAGECDVAVANTYYFGRLAGSDDPDNRTIVSNLRIHWPNQGDGERGTHVNVSGAGITKHAGHRDAAIELLRFLMSKEAQEWYAAVNFEFPVVPGTPVSPVLEALGEFVEDDLPLSALGLRNREAVQLMDRAGWR